MSKKHPQAYLLYVEDCFLWNNEVDAHLFAKGEKSAMLAMTSPVLQMLNEKIDVLSLNPEDEKR